MEITTPVSEITPSLGNVKVWSYDHTIYIESTPGTDYRIVDSAGRLLKEGIAHTSRDEVRLGIQGGIAIVIIKGRAYKVSY